LILYLHPKGKAKLLDEIALESNQYLKTICTADIESLNTFVMYSQGNFLNSNYCVFYLIPHELSANQINTNIQVYLQRKAYLNFTRLAKGQRAEAALWRRMFAI